MAKLNQTRDVMLISIDPIDVEISCNRIALIGLCTHTPTYRTVDCDNCPFVSSIRTGRVNEEIAKWSKSI